MHGYCAMQTCITVAVIKFVQKKSISYQQALIDNLSKGSGNIMDSLPEVRELSISC